MIKSDITLQSDISKELSWEPSLHSEAIVVEVTKGIATISGKVGKFCKMRSAEAAAQRIKGVKGVVMDLAMTSSSANTPTDSDIASSARNALG